MRPGTEPRAPGTPGRCLPTSPGQPSGTCSRTSRELGPTAGWARPSGDGPGRTLIGPPTASLRESGASLPGPSALPLHFSSGEKGHCPHHHPGPHCCLVPGWRLSDPPSLFQGGGSRISQVSFCVSGGDGGTDTLWFNVFLSSLRVWVSVCMQWNKLPTASPLILCTCTAPASALTLTRPVPISAPSASPVTTRGCHTLSAHSAG